MKLAGLDVGTTGCKLNVFDQDGTFLARAYRDYPARRDNNYHEIDPHQIIQSVFEVIKEISSIHPDIDGIGVTSLGESFVLIDEEENPILPAMIYTDPRGADECRELVDKVGMQNIGDITGLRAHEMYSISKLMWIKNNKPDAFNKTKLVLLIEDFVVWLLTRKRQIQYSLATRTMAFDINTNTWSKTIFDAAGIDISLMSTPVPIGTSAGAITKEVAKQTGLNPNCQIVSAAHDQVAALIGAGGNDSSVALDCSGTVECVTPIFDGMPNRQVLLKGSYCTIPFVKENTYVTYCTIYSGGALIKWCSDILAQGTKNEILEEAYGSDEPTGLLVLPHFLGAYNPYMDINSRGAIIGLTCDTSLAEIYRACLEGIAYEMRVNHEILMESGATYDHLLASGGGATSKLWIQIKSDVLNIPITSLETLDTGTVGCAMIAGVSIGAYKDLHEASTFMVKEKETFYPRPEMHKKYNEIYKRYKKMYEAVRPLV